MKYSVIMTSGKARLVIDISLPVKPDGITYPGNPEVTFETLPTTANVITKIGLGSHTGTHVDVPSHSIPGGTTIDQIPLELFCGMARVLDLTSAKVSISVFDLESKSIQAGERILLKTSNSARWNEGFFPDFVFLSPEGAAYLASKGVVLVGIDSLSIKQKGNPDNTPHTNLLDKGIPILEGLDLSEVEEGEYELVCFPLKFIGIDGSPVRAVLIK